MTEQLALNRIIQLTHNLLPDWSKNTYKTHVTLHATYCSEIQQTAPLELTPSYKMMNPADEELDE
jgi:hypothetical protein